jgi:hypothetical protein
MSVPFAAFGGFAVRAYERALDAFTTEFTFARAMLGEGDGS